MQDDLFGGVSPLAGDRDAWERLITAVGPAWLLVAIRGRMGTALQRHHSPDDVLQEALLHAWRDRDRCTWQGVRAFRSWLLQIVDNRIRDLAEHAGRQKRGGDATISSLPDELLLPPRTTTPGRLSAWREQAETMFRALAELPDELREVVRLRLFEELEMADVAARIGIGLSAAKHRLRKGAEIFRRQLRALITASAPNSGPQGPP